MSITSRFIINSRTFSVLTSVEKEKTWILADAQTCQFGLNFFEEINEFRDYLNRKQKDGWEISGVENTKTIPLSRVYKNDKGERVVLTHHPDDIDKGQWIFNVFNQDTQTNDYIILHHIFDRPIYNNKTRQTTISS